MPCVAVVSRCRSDSQLLAHHVDHMAGHMAGSVAWRRCFGSLLSGSRGLRDLRSASGMAKAKGTQRARELCGSLTQDQVWGTFPTVQEQFNTKDLGLIHERIEVTQPAKFAVYPPSHVPIGPSEISNFNACFLSVCHFVVCHFKVQCYVASACLVLYCLESSCTVPFEAEVNGVKKWLTWRHPDNREAMDRINVTVLQPPPPPRH